MHNHLWNYNFIFFFFVERQRQRQTVQLQLKQISVSRFWVKGGFQGPDSIYSMRKFIMAQRLSLGAKSQQRWEATFRSSQPQLIKSWASSPERGKLLTCLKAGMITVLKFFFFYKVVYRESKNKYLKQNKAINCSGGGGKNVCRQI